MIKYISSHRYLEISGLYPKLERQWKIKPLFSSRNAFHIRKKGNLTYKLYFQVLTMKDLDCQKCHYH